MYLYIPRNLFVPIMYINKDALNIDSIEIHYIETICKYGDRKDIVIGVSVPNLRDYIWMMDAEAMEKEAKEKGVTVKIENADFDEAKQVSQVENLISQGIDVLVIAPLDFADKAGLVEKAHKAGVKVISYIALVQNSAPDLYIYPNRKRIGQLQGRYLIQRVPVGKYIILAGDQGGDEYKEGAMEYLQPLINIGNIKVITDKVIKNWDPKIAYEVVKESLIANNNKVDAILSPNDAIAGAAIEALREKGLAGKVAVTGQDAELAAIRRIVEGTQLMTVLKDPRKLGKSAIDYSIKLAKGEVINEDTKTYNGKIYVPTILVEPIAIDKSNIDSELINSGFYKKEEVYNRRNVF